MQLNCSIENSILVETKPRMGLNLNLSGTKRKKDPVDEEEPPIKATGIRLIQNNCGNSLQSNQLSKGEEIIQIIGAMYVG